MGVLTVRGLDEEEARLLKEKARKEGTSVNALLVKALRESLGLKKKKRAVYHDLDHLAGTWNEREAEEFRAKTADFEKVDRDIWK